LQVSIDAGDPGTVHTKFFVMEGTELSVNVNTRSTDSGGHKNLQFGNGSLQVQVEAANQRPVAGFEAENCTAINGVDSVDHLVHWGSADVASLQGRTIRLRFTLTMAKLYSFQFR